MKKEIKEGFYEIWTSCLKFLTLLKIFIKSTMFLLQEDVALFVCLTPNSSVFFHFATLKALGRADCQRLRAEMGLNGFGVLLDYNLFHISLRKTQICLKGQHRKDRTENTQSSLPRVSIITRHTCLVIIIHITHIIVYTQLFKPVNHWPSTFSSR